MFILFLKFTAAYLTVNHDAIIGDNPHTAILYGNLTFGYYYVNIYVGENYTKHSLVIDTGSGRSTFYCNQCRSCGRHQNPPYQYGGNKGDLSLMKDYFNCSEIRDNKCVFQSSYVEGSSIAGFFFLDKTVFGDGLLNLDNNYTHQEQFDAILGCTTSESGQLATQLADGIMGLSPNANPPSLIDLIIKKEQTLKRQFSICLGENNGYMSIGKYNTFRHNKEYTIQNISFENSIFYKVGLKEISFGNQKVQIDSKQYTNGQGTFIDSGATMTYADPKIFTAITQAVAAYVNTAHNDKIINQGKCFLKDKKMLKQDFFNLFPNFQFTFKDDIIIEWTPENYMHFDNAAYCIGIQPLSDRVILGQNWMRGKDILFDLEEKKISFIKADCSISDFHIQISDETKLEEQRTQEEIQTDIEDKNEEDIFIPEEVDSTHTYQNIRKPNEISSYIYDTANSLIEETQSLSWSEIIFYLIMSLLILKGIIFLGMFILKKAGGYQFIYIRNLYQYIENRNKFKKLQNNQDTLQENSKFIELEIQDNKIII